MTANKGEKMAESDVNTKLKFAAIAAISAAISGFLGNQSGNAPVADNVVEVNAKLIVMQRDVDAIKHAVDVIGAAYDPLYRDYQTRMAGNSIVPYKANP